MNEVSFNSAGLLSFNRFMHLFIIITRHSKEQFIKQQRIHLDSRRRAFRLKDWKSYDKIVQHEVDMERLKYIDVVNYSLNKLEISPGSY